MYGITSKIDIVKFVRLPIWKHNMQIKLFILINIIAVGKHKEIFWQFIIINSRPAGCNWSGTDAHLLILGQFCLAVFGSYSKVSVLWDSQNSLWQGELLNIFLK